MSNATGTSGQVISLPKGGGAMHGIGEKFSPDLHTGTGNFTIPLALPPGRNGFQPQINLVYSTGNGNGAFGLGWSLSIPGVSRKTAKGIPRYDDARDTFILSGAEDLVPIEQVDPMTTRYQPRTEGLFARIFHRHSAQEDYWQVHSKDGLVSRYGTPRPDPAPPSWRDGAITCDPDPLTGRIFAWKLTETRDPFGNLIQYEYLPDAGKADAHEWSQPLLAQIRYVDYADQNQTGFLISVTFEYEDRPDPFSDYRAGFEIRTTKRCARIIVQTHAGQDRPVREYRFRYDSDPHNAVSLLRQVEVIGFDDAGTPAAELPPLEFGYTHFEPQRRTFEPLSGELPAGSLTNQGLELVDLFGTGLPDILEMNGTVRYWRNLGGGRFDIPRPMRDAPAGLALADPGVQMLDANGDGRTDLLVTRGGQAGYYPLSFGGVWDRRSFQRYQQAPSFDLEDPEVKLIDLDGDGVTDAIRSGSRLECFFNDPHLGWNATRWVERRALDVFPNVNFSDPRVKWADMSGDGLQDVVLVSDGSVTYWPNLGHGDWGRRIHMRRSPRFPYGYDPRRILIGDVDGDGLADIIYVDHGKVTLWINQGGNGWSEPIVVSGTPVTDADAVRLVDLHGSGISGVLWSTDLTGRERRTLWFLDFTGGVKPYLLNQMDNHMGALTRVQYAPSTRYYLDDQKQPATRWKTPLPFPVQVVARVEVIDEISRGKLTTEYRYHHGYWDGAEREFRGFGMVEQLDTETFDDYHAAGLHGDADRFIDVPQHHFAPPTLTKTWFHQGPVGEEFGDWQELDWSSEYWPGDPQLLRHTEAVNAFLKQLGAYPSPRTRRTQRDALRVLRGSILRSELYALDGTELQDRPYTVTESAYGLREESTPGADDHERSWIFFPHQTAQRTTQWERGDDPMTQFTCTDDHDEYGQPRKQTTIACPRDWRGMSDTSDAYLATRTLTAYAEPLDPQTIYIRDRVAGAATYEIRNTTARTVSAIRDLAEDDFALKLIGQTLHFYDGAAFTGLDNGQVGDYGAVVRTESLVLTQDIVQEAYGAQMPPYLALGAVAWSDEYPQAFRDGLPARAGYRYNDGAGGSPGAAGWWVVAERRRYDIHDGAGCGLVVATRDPLGHETTMRYDAYQLLPVEATDPAQNTILADYNYRVLQPSRVTEPNGNRSEFAFSPMGLLSKTWVRGKAPDEGDQQLPSVMMEYDFLEFELSGRREPIFVRSIRRVHHDSETDLPSEERDQTIVTVEYSDGFGRLAQTRTQAEDVTFGDATFGGDILPADQRDQAGARRDVTGTENAGAEAPNVVVSGWQTYDNKGQVVEKYEPFFAHGWDFQREADAKRGVHATMFYDPRGQVIRTLNPDGSEQRVIYGVPLDLNHPEVFNPTAWEAYAYDANDNAGHTHPIESDGYRQHWNTPSSIVVDALGRTITATVRNGPNPADAYVTRSTYDIQGNLLTVTDPLGRVAFTHAYDLAKHPLRIVSIDAGERHAIHDAAGSIVEGRDSKSALALHAYDSLNRPARLWARDGAGQPMTMRERLIYGDDPSLNLPPGANLRGKLHQHYDEAGLLTFEAYDFKGNLLQKTRQVIGDESILAVFDSRSSGEISAFRVDWDAAPLLEATGHATTIAYDALNRVKTMQYPQDVDGARKELRPRYNRAGALERVELDGATYVERIAYNAKGQRALIAYGNGVLTRYAYDPHTFRLARLRTERYTQPATLTYHPTGAPLQDFAYEYDLAGNIVKIHDRAPGSGIPNTLVGPDALDRAFGYDPLYRLLSATGREHATPPTAPPWLDATRSQDPTLARPYTEQYQYDPAGNIVQIQHQANGGSFTRDFALAPGNNRLATVTIGTTPYAYEYDVNGNLLRESTSRHFEWDYADRMKVFRTQAGSAEPSVHAHYLYDAGGQRVKKLVRKQGAYEVTVYIDGIFEHHRRVQSGESQENNTLHVMDDQSRIALLRVGAPFPGDASPAVSFHLGDHLGSSNLVVDRDGAWVNREEHTPYGETSFGGYAKKRYRFTGKERDEESGLNYHGARYYAPWVGRWASCDPAGMVDGVNLYLYTKDNPNNYIDPTGNQAALHAFIFLEQNPAAKEALTGVGEALLDQAIGLQKLGTTLGKIEAVIDMGRSMAQSYTNAGGGFNGLLDAANQLNPAFGMLHSADMSKQALQEGSYRTFGREGVNTAVGAVGTVGFAIGGAGLTTRAFGLSSRAIGTGSLAGLTEAEIDAAVNTPVKTGSMFRAPAPTKARVDISTPLDRATGIRTIHGHVSGSGLIENYRADVMLIQEFNVPARTSVPGRTGDVATRIRIHTPDVEAPTGSNSATGNTVSIVQGGRRAIPVETTSGTNLEWHLRSTASEDVMNKSHIPIHSPETR